MSYFVTFAYSRSLEQLPRSMIWINLVLLFSFQDPDVILSRMTWSYLCHTFKSPLHDALCMQIRELQWVPGSKDQLHSHFTCKETNDAVIFDDILSHYESEIRDSSVYLSVSMQLLVYGKHDEAAVPQLHCLILSGILGHRVWLKFLANPGISCWFWLTGIEIIHRIFASFER
jgi:hypothetical protein